MSPRLLVVDDERAQIEALHTLLGEAGHEVTGCTDAEEALELLHRQAFAVLLSDLRMPRMDGIELIRRALGIHPDLVPVLMTGHGSIDTAVQAMKIGATDYVLKPFRLSAITPVINRALELHRLRARNRELLEDLARHARQQEAANRELDAFAGRVAQDLRAPVQVMRSFVRLMLDEPAQRLGEKEHERLRHVDEAGRRAERLVEDLLEFAQLGKRALVMQPVDLSAVFEQARAQVEAEVAGSPRHIEWVVRPLPTVPGDASLLQQVFANLVSNAVKFTRPRAVARIEVSAHESAGWCDIWVSDNGVGFDPALADRLFGPFQRLHPASEFEGTGMGLANVKRIVERHGGSVGAEGAEGTGARFVVHLPTARAAEAGHSR